MVNVLKWLYRDNKTRNSGTCWELWGGHITGDHVFLGARRNKPHFAKGQAIRAEGIIDAVLFGCTLPAEKPRLPLIGEEVTVSGYPAGTGHLEHRYAKVHAKRMQRGDPNYSTLTWIGKIDQPMPPHPYNSSLFDSVYGGMSGGLVSAINGEPLGVLVTQNGLADLDGDGWTDDSFDFVSLASIWEVFKDAPLVA